MIREKMHSLTQCTHHIEYIHTHCLPVSTSTSLPLYLCLCLSDFSLRWNARCEKSSTFVCANVLLSTLAAVCAWIAICMICKAETAMNVTLSSMLVQVTRQISGGSTLHYLRVLGRILFVCYSLGGVVYRICGEQAVSVAMAAHESLRDRLYLLGKRLQNREEETGEETKGETKRETKGETKER